MAYFDSTELVNYIRNVFGVEDRTGISCKILKKPKRIPRAGGLPLNFGASGDDSDSDNEIQCSPNYMPDLNEEKFRVESTSNIVNKRLICRISAAEIQRDFNCSDQRPSAQSTNLCENIFHARSNDSLTYEPTSSMTSRMIANTKIEFSSGLEKYAKFETMSGMSGSRTMTIVFSFCKPVPCSIPISIFNRATLSDLIGLSCYVYTREKRTPPCDDPSCYSLYLAEENLDYDTELPPQDRHRLVIECGFPILALVKNLELLQNQLFSVTVYFVNGECTTYNIESLDIPLQWLFDKVLKKRLEQDAAVRRSRNSLLREAEYVLETVRQKDCPLKLSNTISSTGCTDFVFLRLNSSRGEHFNSTIGVNFLSRSSSNQLNFEPREKQFKTFASSLSKKKSLLTMRSQAFDQSSILNNAEAVMGNNICGKILEEYLVDRLHKIKPKWPARFVIREYGLEIVPTLAEKRKSFVPQSTQKTSRIFWELIGAVDVNLAERSNSRRIVRIIFLLVPECYHYLFTHLTAKSELRGTRYGYSKMLNQQTGITEDLIVKAYELSVWKTLQVEVGNREAWYIGMKLSEILDANRSAVQLVYKHSALGTKRPLHAAEAALNLTLLSSKVTVPLTPPSTSIVVRNASSAELSHSRPKSERRTFSMVFSKMLSRQD